MHSSDAAELSSIATAIEELIERITAMAKTYVDTPREDISIRLYNVERGLRQAERSLRVAQRDLPSG
ncbi:MAG: hypothetical protein HKN26_17105 [Acidimicrobiales bacterium]|nr:hypothetical protein [Acidimicrobiales bacterium]